VVVSIQRAAEDTMACTEHNHSAMPCLDNGSDRQT